MLAWAAAVPAQQFTVTRQLVLAPTTVKDSQGRFVDGLTPADFLLYDNNTRLPVESDWSEYPVSQVVAVQTSVNASAVLDKFNRTGVLLTDLMAGARGETAVLSYSDVVSQRLAFTSDTNAVSHALIRLRTEGSGAVALDAIEAALKLFDALPPNRRRILVMIGERRDRQSQARLARVVEGVARRNVVVYWLTYSPFLTAFTARPKVADHETPEEQRRDWKHRDDSLPLPPPEPMNLMNAITQIGKSPDLAELFTRQTGGRVGSFLKKGSLGDLLHVLSNEIHRQYILSFQPPAADAEDLHTIRVEVKDRPNLDVTTRASYWAAR